MHETGNGKKYRVILRKRHMNEILAKRKKRPYSLKPLFAEGYITQLATDYCDTCDTSVIHGGCSTDPLWLFSKRMRLFQVIYPLLVVNQSLIPKKYSQTESVWKSMPIFQKISCLSKRTFLVAHRSHACTLWNFLSGNVCCWYKCIVNIDAPLSMHQWGIFDLSL